MVVPIVDWPPVSIQEVGEGGYSDKGCQENGEGKVDGTGHSVSTSNGGCLGKGKAKLRANC